MAALLALGLVPGRAAPQESPRIGEVRFEGLAQVDTALVREALVFAPGELLRPSRIAQSVQALYDLGLFSDVIVAAAPGAAGATDLTLRFVERRALGEVTFSGNHSFSAEDLQTTAALETGKMLTQATLFQARRKIAEAYRNDGYAQAQVQASVSPDSLRLPARVTITIDEGERVKLRGVHFAGETQFPAGKLRDAIKLRPAGFLRKGRFTMEKLVEDEQRLREYYQNRGYRDVQVRSDPPAYSADGSSVEVTFQIVPGTQYRFAAPAWSGATVIDSVALAEATAFARGEIYDQSKVEATRAAAIELYTERGYLTALSIDPEPVAAGDSVQVIFAVTEGSPSQVGNVDIVGNTTTRERVIRRELSVYPGSLLRRSQLLRSQRDVFATGYFEDVQLEFAPGDTLEQVDVIFRVKEKSSVMATAGAGYSSQVGLTGFVEFGHNNLFGRGQSVSLKLERGSSREYYDLSFTEPWAFGRPISMGFDLYSTEYYREIYTGSDVEQSYWQSRRGGGVRFGLPWPLKFPDYTRIALGYSLSKTEYTEFENLPEETEELLTLGSGTLSDFFLSLSRNSTDNPFHPTLGTRTTWRNEFNGGVLGGDMDYYELNLDHRQYFVPFWKPVVMLRWRLGVMGPYHRGGRLPPAERFRMGGTSGFDYLRGYHDYYVVPDENITVDSSGDETRFPGGLTMFGFTGEIQFPLFDPVHGLVFLDAGNTWNSTYDASLDDLKFGTGVGVTLEIPMLGPIGFYYAYGSESRKWMTHFAFGTQL